MILVFYPIQENKHPKLLPAGNFAISHFLVLTLSNRSFSFFSLIVVKRAPLVKGVKR